MALYSGGLIIGRIFTSEIWGAYFLEGLFSEGLIIGVLRYLKALSVCPGRGSNPLLTPCQLLSKGKVCIRAKWPIRPALNSGFRSMKRLGILLLPPGWDASPSQGYPPALWSPVPIYTPGWRETMWNKVSCLRKQHDGSDQARTTDL